jgi:oligogalacturonide lyase
MARGTRRSFLFAAFAASRLAADGHKGSAFPTEWQRYQDPTTELDVYRLTDPAYSSTLPAYYNRAISRNSGTLLYTSDREGTPQAFRMDLKTGAAKQLTEVPDLDGSSLTLTPDNRSFCYFAGRKLYLSNLTSLRERQLYEIPEGWERCEGMSVGPDGTHATFAERKGDTSRLRMISLAQGVPRLIVEAPYVISHPVHRPMRAQILYRRGQESLWLVDEDGKPNRQLKIAEGAAGPANWSPDGKSIVYLSIPADTTQLAQLRELTPDANTEKLIAKTSQFAAFGMNHDSSVFVGASRSNASPTILLLLRVTRREMTLCEHKASHAESVGPRFSPDSQRIYFESDRHGKPALYCMHVERLVEKTDM